MIYSEHIKLMFPMALMGIRTVLFRRHHHTSNDFTGNRDLSMSHQSATIQKKINKASFQANMI